MGFQDDRDKHRERLAIDKDRERQIEAWRGSLCRGTKVRWLRSIGGYGHTVWVEDCEVLGVTPFRVTIQFLGSDRSVENPRQVGKLVTRRVKATSLFPPLERPNREEG